jgi:hypothetical protein
LFWIQEEMGLVVVTKYVFVTDSIPFTESTILTRSIPITSHLLHPYHHKPSNMTSETLPHIALFYFLSKDIGDDNGALVKLMR